ncbi:tetratricopeptide repeat protein, partial [Angustibacter aerolatus]
MTTAGRALGLAHRALGDPAAAERVLRSALASATRRRDPVAVAEARMTLSLVLLDQGQVPAALRQARRAAPDLRGVEGARMLAQHALILQRSGEVDEALAMHGQALAGLVASDDWLWQLRVHSNRGLLQAYRGDLRAADRDLAVAEQLSLRHDRVVDAAMSGWNRGWVASLRGDAVTALALYDRHGTVLDRHDVGVPQRLVDRAELLLSVGAAGEARRLGEQAAVLLERAGLAADLDQCRVLLARAALLDGHGEQAAAQAAL